MSAFSHIIAVGNDRGFYADDTLTEDVVYEDPREFISSIFGNEIVVYYPYLRSESEPRGTYSLTIILAKFCNKVFQTTVEDPTSLWHDPLMGIFYVLGYTFSDDDYYHSAYQYLEIVDIIPPPERTE